MLDQMIKCSWGPKRELGCDIGGQMVNLVCLMHTVDIMYQVMNTRIN